MTDAPVLPPDDDELEWEVAKEGLALNANGTIHLWIDGTKRRLRRPRLREFRSIREAFQEATDAISVESDRADQWEKEITETVRLRRETNPAANLTLQERQEDQRRGRSLADFIEREMLGWWVHVIDTLGHEHNAPLEWEHVGDCQDPDGQHDHRNCEKDRTIGLTPWLASTKTANTVINHWRAAPSLSGVR